MTDFFNERERQEMAQYATALIARYYPRYMGVIEPSDAVHEACLIFHNDGIKHSVDYFKKCVKRALAAIYYDISKNSTRPLVEYKPNRSIQPVDTHEGVVCCRCKARLNSSMFYRTNRGTLRSYCKACDIEASNKRQKASDYRYRRQGTAELSDWYVIGAMKRTEQYRGRPNSWYETHPEEVEKYRRKLRWRRELVEYINAYATSNDRPERMRLLQKFHAEKLSDAYVIRRIYYTDKSKPWVWYYDHPEIIEKKRQELIEQRNRPKRTCAERARDRRRNLADSEVTRRLCDQRKRNRYSLEFLKQHPEIIEKEREFMIKLRELERRSKTERIPFPNFQNTNSSET